MELDQLKQMWQEQASPQTEGLKEIIGKRSNSPIARMKRAIIFELILVTLLFGTVVVFYLFEFGGKFRLIGWLYLSMAVLFFIYFYFKYRLLNDMECMSCQIISNLSKQVQTLEKFTRLYLIAGTAAIPIVLVFVYLFELTHSPLGSGIFKLPSENTSVVSSIVQLFLIITAFTVPIYFLNKWYIRKLYGQHIERLKKMLEQVS